MCRGLSVCSELGSNPGQWDRECLLRPPAWIGTCIDTFIEAMDCLIKGNRNGCLELLKKIQEREKAFTNWYIEHGQISGNHRARILKHSRPAAISTALDPVRNASKKLEVEILKRDHYHCRYCGCRLIDRKVLQAFVDTLASPLLTRGSTNLEKHGVILASWPYIDHVVPHSLGGRTDAGNLVSSCYSCNFGKDGYSCEQVGISNPRSRDPLNDGWDGLQSRLPLLKRL